MQNKAFLFYTMEEVNVSDEMKFLILQIALSYHDYAFKDVKGSRFFSLLFNESYHLEHFSLPFKQTKNAFSWNSHRCRQTNII